MVRTATPRLEVWFSQPLWPDPIERGAASSQHAAREQDCANQDCDQHGAHDTEPFLVGRRVGDFAFKNFAHRTTPSMNRYAVSRARDCLCGKIGDNCGASDATSEKPGGVAFGTQCDRGPPLYR